MRPETSLEIGLKMHLETNQWMAIEFHDLADCPAGLAWMQQVDCIKIIFFDGFICMERGSTSDPFLSPRLRGPTQGLPTGPSASESAVQTCRIHVQADANATKT